MSYSFLTWFTDAAFAVQTGIEQLARKDVFAFFLDLVLKKLQDLRRHVENAQDISSVAVAKIDEEAAKKFILKLGPHMMAWPHGDGDATQPGNIVPDDEENDEGPREPVLVNERPRPIDLTRCLSAALDLIVAKSATVESSSAADDTTQYLQAFFDEFFGGDAAQFGTANDDASPVRDYFCVWHYCLKWACQYRLR